MPPSHVPRSRRTIAAAAGFLAALSLAGWSSLAQARQDPAPRERQADEGVLGDDFARDTGAIIVTADRPGGGNLFEPVEVPTDSCLATAPAIGSRSPGFAIDASAMRSVRELERVRKKTQAGTIFVTGASFVGADFSRAKLHDMCFFKSDLSQSDWSDLSATGLGFVETDLTGANFSGSTLPFVLFRDARLGLVNANGASWQQGRVDGGWDGSLRELDLTDADLTGFEIVCGTSADDGCPTERGGIVMAGANLRRASLHSFYVGDLVLAGARIDQTELALDQLRFLEGARLAGPIVLRSPRRAIMLFPGEVAALADTAETASDETGVCMDPGDRALAMLCAEPGSATRSLLESVAQLEEGSSAFEDYAERRVVWLSSRDSCFGLPDGEQQLECLRTAYTARQAALRDRAGNPQWLAEAGYRLFLSREAAYPTVEASPGLYGRILPVLLDSAVAAIMVRTDGEGQAAAKGVSEDGCYFEVENLAYDAGEAALSFSKAGRRASDPRVLEEALIGLSGTGAKVRDAGLARAAGSCASDNPFPQLEEIELDERLLASIWERF